jgi:hypothetical protein
MPETICLAKKLSKFRQKYIFLVNSANSKVSADSSIKSNIIINETKELTFWIFKVKRFSWFSVDFVLKKIDILI